jgi:Mg-chelatase subunit ChlD
VLDGSHEAAQRIVTAGASVEMVLTLRGDCPSGAGARADILLLLDRSRSMADEGKLEAAHRAVREFVGTVDFERHRMGLVPFTTEAYVLQTLTHDPQRVLDALDRSGAAEHATNIAEAITVAAAEFDSTARPGAVRVMVLLTDGRSNAQTMAAAAAAAMDVGTVMFAIGLGPDADQDALRLVASSREHVAYAPSPAELEAIYNRIAAIIQSFSVTDTWLTARQGLGSSYVAGSGDPDEPGGGHELSWWRPVVTAGGTTLHYRLRLSRVGRYRPIESTWADYIDGDGTRRRYTFPPMAEVEVIDPLVYKAYLPLSWQRGCVRALTGADVVLALDNSDSMRGQKLADAVGAAATFLRLLDPRHDQAAVVSYDATAAVRSGLTADWSALDRALGQITTGNGTRLDRGLTAATQVLLGSGRRAGNRPVIVLLSDGRQTEARADAVAAAEVARSAGIDVFAIGLGADADRSLLEAVAGSPSRAFFTPDASELERIYTAVGGVVACR